MLIAQISDPHIKAPGEKLYGRIDTAGYLERAVTHLLQQSQQPDIVLMTGDLVNEGAPEQYAHLRSLLAPLRMPVYLIPGNHDARDALRGAFPDHRYLPSSGFIQYVVEDLPLRLIALDTLIEGAGRGELCDTRLDWLEERLAESRKPTVLFMHHPPFDIGLAYLDRERLHRGDARLAALVRRHDNIERVLCGHVHRPITVRWAGTTASAIPSTAHQATLDLVSPDLTMTFDPPAIALHLWRPVTGLISHLSFVGTYKGPKPFH